jgi:nucleotide-binding universal stress UspA family protein
MPGDRPIIAAIDPRRHDDGAAGLGLLLARVTGAPLLLVSAYAVDPPVDGLYTEHAEAMRAQTLETVERVRRQLLADAGGTVAVTSTVLACEGSPAGAIHRLAERKAAATIVVGSSSRGPLGRMLPGAVTDRLLHGAPCPVAVATSGYSGERLRVIGIAFLERPDGRAALAHASRLAEAAGAQVQVLTVREPVDWTFTSGLESTQLAAMQRAADEAATRTLDAGLHAIPASRSAAGEVLAGKAQDALAAASVELDLLVCGSRGHGPFQTVLLGGVSHALVRHAACPVVVVPLPEPAPDPAADRSSVTAG